MGSLLRLLPAALAVALQCSVIYAPSGGGTLPFAHFDKVVHAAVFAVPVFLAILARLPVLPVVLVMAAHAPVSEIVQGTLLPRRSGDAWDAVADLVGVALGALIAARVVRGRPERW